MLQKYEQNFLGLSDDEAGYVADALFARYGHPLRETMTGEELYRGLVQLGVGQADVVMAMANHTDPMAVVCLEKIVGRPIVRNAPETAAPVQRAVAGNPSPRTPRVRVERTDPRVVTEVVPNPKKPGSKSHERYALYRVGMTVSEFIRAGGTMADVTHDLGKGFIKLGDSV